MKAALVMALFLCACAGEPTVVREPVEVKVPIEVPCKPKDVPVPPWATDQVSDDADYFEKTRAVVEELAQRIAYEIQLKAALAGCAGKPTP